jgi:hypothetical protein
MVSTDNVTGGGELWIGNQRHPGSLSIRAHTAHNTAFDRFRVDVDPTLPRILRNRALQLAVAIGYQAALLTLVFGLLAGRGLGVGGNPQ